ncbi:hypothetical protein A3C98_01325 [Candidatus Roizmanbacteria bacterium RIFCSPHIGHO2_02_FULL_37_15]|nr:MAG: hypothetical protein A2859_02810 [Candidatus Roizmanbacteria bacterium RIFCSPHIGHO2_01_FULL_37_16b]OGK22088.1 MAG: hypothetical protein A3C98_01325 [Candidatus Roizmanbacteria bacterium RIFCSPHIGHO2_02_FULL_37_15]OGK33180.1 MAG: hypothetical protein A3F57_01205 [Candidatus Roizmanbacteria bacterium RIFCSPHIGHO2_12_FULL_36_11]
MEKKSKIIWQNLTLTIVVLFLILAGSMYYLNFLSTSWEFSNLRFRQATGQVQSNYPSEVINLTNWKLTLPTGNYKDPDEIKQPELENYVIDPWFIVSSRQNAIRFRAPVNGVTTKGSNYPRTELREMTDDGKSKASWSSTWGRHTMFIDQAITAVPWIKKQVVAGQIHDSEDDVIVIRLDYPKLYINVDGKNKYTLEQKYQLGKRFKLRFEVEEGRTKIYYNGSRQPVYILSKKYSEAYFKAGAYSQSNCQKELIFLCHNRNYGEVLLYQLSVSHET